MEEPKLEKLDHSALKDGDNNLITGLEGFEHEVARLKTQYKFEKERMMSLHVEFQKRWGTNLLNVANSIENCLPDPLEEKSDEKEDKKES